MNELDVPVKEITNKMEKDTFFFLKVSAQLLLLISFVVVLFTWVTLIDSSELNAPLKSILFIPIMLFCVMGIINIMLFAKQGPSTFLAVFIIGAVIVGPELSNVGASMATGNAVSGGNSEQYSSGGIGTSQYGAEGGLAKEKLLDENRSIYD